MTRFWLTLAGVAALWGADGDVSKPTLGYVADRGAAVPIFGVPGSSLLGEPVEFPDGPVTIVSVAPGRDYAVGVSEGVSYRLDLRTGSRRALGEFVAEKVVWSPTGSAAALTTGKNIRLFSNLHTGNAQAVSIWQASTDAQLSAVADDGSLALLLRKSDAEIVLEAVSSEGSTRRIAADTALISAAFLKDSHDVVAVDGESGRVLLARDLGAAGVVGTVAGASAVGGAANGRELYVASRSKGTVNVLNIADGAVATYQCSCEPEFVLPMGSPDLFRVTDGARGPVWLFAPKRSFPFAFVPMREVVLE